MISAGYEYNCGVRTDGAVACWGDYDFGQSTPPMGKFTSVTAGKVHTCGIKTDGSNNLLGQWRVRTSHAAGGEVYIRNRWERTHLRREN